LQFQGSETEFLLNNAIRCFPAADVLVLVTAAHVHEPALLKRFKGHGCRIVVAGKEVPGFVGEALPAFEAQDLRSQFKRAPVDKEHLLILPLHGHGIKDREQWRGAELFVAIGARGVAAADKDSVEIRVVVVAKDRDHPVLA